MSRIGRKEIEIPSGVEVSIGNEQVSIKGPKGELVVSLPQGVSAETSENRLMAKRASDQKKERALHGLTRALLANAVKGVSEGFVKKLDVVGIGYRAEMRGQWLNLSLGHSHLVEFPVPEGIEITVNREQRNLSNYVVTIAVSGADRYRVGQVAADIRALRPPDAYKGKGVRYANELVRTKVGKKGA